MKVNKEKLIDKLEKISFTDLGKYLGVTRATIYYHYYNLKIGKLTFSIETIKKISMYLTDKENFFFEWNLYKKYKN